MNLTPYACECGLVYKMADGWWPFHCRCGRKYVDRAASVAGVGLTQEEQVAQADADFRKLKEAADRGGLAGDWVAALTSKIGIPPCGACKKRQAWLNKAHRWVLDQTQSLRGAS